jgi:transposase-like protein
MEKASLQQLLDQGISVGRIAKRFGKDPSTISYWMKKYGLESPYAEKHSAKGGIERETLEELVEQGMTIAEIAQEVGLSKGTVRHWLKRYGLKTKNGRGTRQRGIAASGKAAGRRTITMTCIRHGDTDFVIEGRGYYRCKQCRVERVVERRRKVKRILWKRPGGNAGSAAMTGASVRWSSITSTPRKSGSR